MYMGCWLSAASQLEEGPWEPASMLEYWLDSSCSDNHSSWELEQSCLSQLEDSVWQHSFLTSVSYRLSGVPLLRRSPRKDVLSKVFFFQLKLSGRKFLRCDFNIEFSLVGRSHLGWKEGLGDRGSWALGSGPAIPFPEKGVHDNEFTVGSTSAPRQGRSHLRLYNLEYLF